MSTTKGGTLPVFETEKKNRWNKGPTLLRLFIHPNMPEGSSVPSDLREKLRAFVPKPAASKLSTLEQFPEQPPREWTSHRFDIEKRTTVYERHELPLIVRLTEQTAFKDLSVDVSTHQSAVHFSTFRSLEN